MMHITDLLKTKIIRKRSSQIFEYAQQGKALYFNVSKQGVIEASRRTLKCIEEHYPSWKIPFHSRWRHFSCLSLDRVDLLRKMVSVDSWVDCCIELAIVSVLLDAGAGHEWNYLDKRTGNTYRSSEGLAIACWNGYVEGFFSSTKKKIEVNASRLMELQVKDLEVLFQVSQKNPLLALRERVVLLNSLGKRFLDVMQQERLGLLWRDFPKKMAAEEVLLNLLYLLNPIWPQGFVFQGVHLGDVGQHSLLKTDDDTSCCMPFHKLTQWMAYSLLEPLQESGIEIYDLDGLTALAEYRNGGLLIDCGALVLKDKDLFLNEWDPLSELIVEWRALTIALIDQIADEIRKEKRYSVSQLPLASILQGGTWLAGRIIAKEKRKDGAPPLKIKLNGTMF